MTSLKPYKYAVIRYVHDHGANERMNIGVVLFAPDFFEARVETRYERLSHAFQGFDGESYRGALARFQSGINQIRRQRENEPLFFESARELDQAVQAIWPDTDSSFTFSHVRSGVSSDLTVELEMLFDRMVSSQQPAGDENTRRDDDQLWRKVYVPRLPDRVVRSLQSKTFATRDIEVTFDRAIKNGKWHVVQPVSMDFKTADSMQRKATHWLGTTVGLDAAPDLARIYFLLGKPKAGHRKAYERAKHLLDRSPVPHELIEENEVDVLSRKLEALVDHDHS